jgi:hypothetical protein
VGVARPSRIAPDKENVTPEKEIGKTMLHCKLNVLSILIEVLFLITKNKR